jgi:hypothetical protein
LPNASELIQIDGNTLLPCAFDQFVAVLPNKLFSLSGLAFFEVIGRFRGPARLDVVAERM